MRPFLPDDAPAFAELGGARDIADTMLSIPHPFSVAIARSTIAANAASFQAGHAVHFAIEEKRSERLIGSIDLLDLDSTHAQAELTFWLAGAVWGRGYASEAAQSVVRYGFEACALNRIYAYHLVRSPQAGAVLRKAGMQPEGVLRERVQKWGVFEDVALLAALRSDARVATPSEIAPSSSPPASN